MATGKFANQLNTLGVASVVGASDFFTVYDASATEQKAIAASDVLKRLLSTTDVTWLSSLAMSAVDATNDKFVIWDASATAIKVMTASELLNQTLAGVTDPSLSLTPSTWSTAGDTMLMFDVSASLWKKVDIQFIVNGLSPSYAITTDYTATPTTVLTTRTGWRHTNRGASAILEFDLPAATTGLRYTFTRITDYAVRIDPDGTDTIGEGGAGKYLEITNRGSVDLICLVAGAWEVTGGSVLYSFEA